MRLAIDNLRLDVSDGTESSRTTRRADRGGLLVTCLWYNRVVDPQTLLLTGLTRDGVYVVEGGEVVGATTNFRFNDSPVVAAGPGHRRGRDGTDAGPGDGRLLQPVGDAAAAGVAASTSPRVSQAS